jgi:hypothetical protein
MKTTILLFTLPIFFSVTARAELQWEQTQVELHPGPTDKQAIGHFKYQNVGEKPVQFKSVHSSCGCTVAQTQKERVEPGEKGEITATFNIGDRTGTQVKTVTVETDEPNNAVATLTLKAVLPELLQIQPTLVSWNQGEPPKSKTVSVRPGKDFHVGALRATSSNPQLFSTKVTANKDKSEFKIEVTPTDTTHAAAGVLTIQPDNSPRLFYATTRVMNAPAAAQ